MEDTKLGKTPKDIERETGIPFVEVVKGYLTEGFAPVEIARKLGLNNQSNIRKAIKEEEHKQQPVLYPEVFRQGRSLEESEALFRSMTGQDLRDFLYQKHVVERRSAYEIAPMFGASNGTITTRLNTYGFGRNRSGARKALIENGTIVYAEINTKTAHTTRKSKANSHGQDAALQLLQAKLEDAFQRGQLGDCEVVIGCNNWSIVHGKEVDIPVVVLDRLHGTTAKYSIEYNGTHWHPDPERDGEKAAALRSRGWRHYIIWDKALSNRQLAEEIDTIVNDVINHLAQTEA